MEAIRVLLVDDEVIIKRVLSEKVDWGRFDMKIVGTASSAPEALAFLDRFPVDLVIADIKMPYMDGNDLIEKASVLNKKLHFLVLSAYTEFSIVRRSFTLGVYDYLQKSDINTANMNNILIKLRNEIIDERTKESQSMPAGRPGESPVFAVKVSGHKQYTVLHVHLHHTDTVNLASEIIERSIGQAKLMLASRFVDHLLFYIEHSQKSTQGMEHEKTEVIGLLRANLAGEFTEPGIGVSTTGPGTAIEYLKREAEQALESEYYALAGQTVFYHNHRGCKDADENPRLSADYWTGLIREQINCLNLEAASAQLGELLAFIKACQLEKAHCHQLVFDVYFFYISYLKNHNILDLEKEIEPDPHVIDNIIRQFDRFQKLGEWIASNLERIMNGFILKYRSEMIEIIKVYVNLNLSGDLTLSRIAKYYGVNGSYISHHFKEKEGLSLSKYINEVRVNQAKHYLVHTNLKILDICNLVGYNNPEHFSRLFKEKFGKSPNQYREETLP